MSQPFYALTELVARFGGQIQGAADTKISQVATLEHAATGQIAFLANNKYRKQLEATAASAVIVTEADAETTQLPCIVSNNPYSYFAKLSAFLNPPIKYAAGIHPSAVIGEGAQIAPSVYIAAHVVIGAGAKIGADSVIMAGCSIGAGTVLGDNARLYPNVTIYHNCQIGHNFIAHSGAVIGSDGFGLAMEAGRWLKIPQIGRVVIGDDVEVGANTTIDRGALDDTVIEDDVKLDNQIQVAHNVRIGAHTAIAGCVGIAGSSVIGRYCQIGGSAMILGHLQIADKSVISAGTLISKTVREAGTYTAIYPFSETHEWRKNAVHLRRLDEMFARIKKLEDELASSKAK
jgi:UDP-3-O-[3-hydroxymyristoyl] glucosamine N-acyltransferase